MCKEMTRKELKRFVTKETDVIQGKCVYHSLPYEEKERFTELGYNHGIYGLNWTAYKDFVNDVVIVEGNRNFI